VPTDYEPTQPWILPLAAAQGISADILSSDWLTSRVCAPDPEIREELAARGFDFAVGLTDGMSRSLHGVALIFREIISLEAAVSDCVSRIVPLLAEPDYDISHSEPRWDALIFVTIPEGGDHRAALRSLENIVHEAMHVQLTRLEKKLPLIADETATMPSPWRDQPRHLRGVLHGAYVFECIRKCFIQLESKVSLDEGGRRYISSRITQIGEEVGRVDLGRLSAGMTQEGRRFVESLLTAT
jgi:HEXXH motif-containing protein